MQQLRDNRALHTMCLCPKLCQNLGVGKEYIIAHQGLQIPKQDRERFTHSEKTTPKSKKVPQYLNELHRFSSTGSLFRLLLLNFLLINSVLCPFSCSAPLPLLYIAFSSPLPKSSFQTEWQWKWKARVLQVKPAWFGVWDCVAVYKRKRRVKEAQGSGFSKLTLTEMGS